MKKNKLNKKINNYFLRRKINLSYLSAIIKKELLVAIRDTRSLIMMLLPVLMFPIIFCMLDNQISNAQNDVSQNITIAITGSVSGEYLIHALSSYDNIIIETSDNITDEINTGHALLAFDFTKTTPIIIYDQNSVRSCTALSQVDALIDILEHEAICSELIASGSDSSVMNRFSRQVIELSAYSDSSSNALLVSIIPLLIVMFIFNGGTAVAIDVFCGEKERGTLECLLLSQVNRNIIITAKMIVIFLYCIITTLLSIFGYLIAIYMNPNVASLYGTTKNALISSDSLICVIGISMCFTFFAVTLMTYLSISSHSLKEGQMKMNVLTLLPALIGGISIYMELSTTSLITMLIPILNIILLLKQILSGIAENNSFILTMGSCLIYGIIFLVINIKYFNSEKLFQ